jgi:hypothetical protein
VVSFLFSALLIVTIPAFPQAISASQVQGTVRDTTGAVLPGVTITMTQTNTGLTRSAVSETDGGYLIPALPPGPYRLEATLQGFKTYVQNGVELEVGINPRIVITMELGAVAESISVDANAPLVETQSTAVGQVMTRQKLEQMPINNRDVTTLVYLMPAAHEGRSTRTNYGPGGASYGATQFPSLAGGITGSVAFALDGGTHNDPVNNGNLPLPFPDAVQEFRVQTSTQDAQYGYHSSGVVSVVLKSGTNAVHGSGFEYLQDSRFNATRAFVPSKEPMHRNQFGGTLGGPVKKDRLFYFFGYQGTVQDQVSSLTSTVPTAAMLQGDFTAFTSPACQSRGQVNLSSALGFADNRIDPSRLNPIAVRFASKYLPVGQANACGLVAYSGHSPANNPTEHQIVGRGDYQMGQRQSVFVRLFNTHLRLPAGEASENPLFLPQVGQDNNVFSSVVGHNLFITSKTVSQFRVTYNYNVQEIVVPSYFDWAALGIPNINVAESPDYIGGLNVTGAFNFGSTPSRQPYKTYQLSEDMSSSLGKHQFNYGVNWIYMKAEALNQLNRNGSFTFSGQRSGSNLALVDFLLGLPSSFGQAAPVPSLQTETVFGMYVQDVWRVSSKLTANLGLRWDPMLGHGAPGEDTAYYYSEDALIRNVHSTVYPNAPAGLLFVGDPGGPESNQYFPNEWWNFSPRVGLAWDPKGNGRTSIRASFGLQHEIPSFAVDQFGFSPPLGISIQRNFPLDPPRFDDPWLGYPGGNPFPAAFTPGHNAVWLQGTQVLSYESDTKSPYVEQWNVALEKQVRDWIVSASYLGNRTVHMWNDWNPNPTVPIRIGATAATSVVQRRLALLNPTAGPYYGPVGILDDNGEAEYSGFVLATRGRMGQVLNTTANYTFSHCTSDPYSIALGLAAFQQSNPYDRGFDRGTCIAQRNHVLNLTAAATVPHLSNRWLSDWRAAVTGRFMSGQFLNATLGTDRALVGTSTQRPSISGNPYATDKSAEQWLDPTAFTLPDLGTYGNERVNDLLGPKNIQLDLAISRLFGLAGHRVEARVEAFNFLNLVNLANPITALNNANFGKIHVGTTGAAAGTLGQARTMQFAIRYMF